MKNILVFALFICMACANAEAQNERWDSKSCMYSNYTYGFYWKLLPDIKWIKVPGIEKHTVFRATTAKDIMTCFVSVSSEDGQHKYDPWETFEYLKSKMNQVDEIIYENSGEKITDRTFLKCIFCGRKAIKTTYTAIVNDDRYDEPYVIKAIDYIYTYNNRTYIVSAKMPLELYNNVKNSVSDLFMGYGISVMYNDKKN